MERGRILPLVTEIARSVVASEAETTDREARWPERGLRALQSAKLGGLMVPREAGGLGGGMLDLLTACTELGRVCASTAICFGMHCVGTAVIAAKATPDQKDRYLVPIAEGAHWTTLALSEPETGVHFYLPRTRLESLDGESLRVTGRKSFVTNGGHADSYVISAAAAQPDAAPGQFSCLVLPSRTAGLSWSGAWHGWGMRGNSAITLDLPGVGISRRDLLGEEGDQIWYVFHVIAPYFLVAMAGTYLGIALSALEHVKAHLVRRRYGHSGQTIAQSPVVQHRFGELWARVERTRQLLSYAAHAGDTNAEDSLPALCSAKAEVAECVVGVVNDAMTLMGGLGYRDNETIQRCLRDARASHVMSPTTDLLRTWAGRALLGEPLLGD